jgi:hypothetical protein
MTRKDSEKDSERPHYYSQFWLDIAAGRRVIGGPKTSDDVEAADSETAEPAPRHKAERASEPEEDFAGDNGHEAAVVHPVVEEETAIDEFELEEEEPEIEEVESPDLQDTTLDDIDVPDMDLTPADEEEEELFDEEEEEEDEDIGWGGRGRKKPKPSRPTKQPQKKPGPGRRDTRRGGY